MRSCVQVTVTMDAKDLRTESALGERNNDNSKYSQSGGIALHCDRNKSYQDIGSNSLAKLDVQIARPCAVIGPDRVVPPPVTNEAYAKKVTTEPWPCVDNSFHTRRPTEYSHKLANFQNPTRNISPRQTFQENMQRIMVPPSYNSVKISDDTNYVQMSDRSNVLPKNIKINVPPEAKFCDVPYTVYPPNNEQKSVRNPDMCLPSVNPTLTRTAPPGWPPGSVNVRPPRMYGAPEHYQYQEYPSCAGPRPVVPRPSRTVPEESGYVYPDAFYHQEGNIRFKPYPTVKDRFPHQRYEYISNYANSFHPPPPFPSHKYDLSKTVPPHPYPPYPPIKYLDRVPEPSIEGYQRNPQGNYNIPYRNQIIHPSYGPVLGNCAQNKIHSYPPDAHMKPLGPNKVPYDKAYIEYENSRPKMYAPSDAYHVNEMGRMHPMKSQVIMPNYPTLNMHNIPTNSFYKKDNPQMKNYEYLHTHFRGMDPNINIHNPMVRHPSVFSPNTSAISPTDSSASNDNSQTLGTSQEDCGYVSQSSTASVRSMDSGVRIPNDYIRKYYDSRFGPLIRGAPMMLKTDLSSNASSKEKKNIDVRQFLQMWNEGDEEAEDNNNSKEVIIQTGPKNDSNFGKPHEMISQSEQEQLYVLGLVNVPSEELGKYEHIQKVSKLPENIKGYNHIELLNQFEEAIEFSNMNNYKTSSSKDFQTPKAVPLKQTMGIVPPRPLSPLDVESKISQSVIHKEVGCNFEIKPCSPKMLNVEVATPVQTILGERAIEKVANPVMLKSPRLNSMDENIDCNIIKRKDHRMNLNTESTRIPSCKMINTQFSSNMDSIKNSYSLQDLESNSGLCLASLPRLDNDIELNFPEVNQQFINANKPDSAASSSLRDLPSLELIDHSDIPSNNKLNDIHSSNKVGDVLKSPCNVEPDKDLSKLSKYRKTKTHHKNSHHIINAARTDSVIIKNPDNIKNYEEKSIVSPTCLNKQVDEIQQVPINLTAQVNLTESSENISFNANIEKDMSVEIAIDFSLNKNNDNAESNYIKKDKEKKYRHTIKTNRLMLGGKLNKLPSLSDCDQNTSVSDKNRGENKIRPENENISIETQNNEEKIKTTSLTENLSFGEIMMKTECLSPLSPIRDANETDCNSSVECIKDDLPNPLFPIEFDTTLSTKTGDEVISHLTNESNDITKTPFDKDHNISMINLENDLNIYKGITKNNTLTDSITKDNLDQKLSQDAGSSGSVNCNDLTNKEEIEMNLTKSNKSNKKIYSIFDSPPSSNINMDNQGDNEKEILTQENEFNLSFPSSTTSQSSNLPSYDVTEEKSPGPNPPMSVISKTTIESPKHYPSVTSEPETFSDLHIINDNVDQNEETEFVSPENITASSSNDYQAADVPKCESDSNSSSQPTEEESSFTLPDAMLTPSPNNHQADIIEAENTSNSNNGITCELNEISEPSQLNVLDTDIISPNIAVTYRSTEDLPDINSPTSILAEVRGFRMETDNEEEENKNESISITKETEIQFPFKNAKHIKRFFLPYGSKAMYSPWIQNLIMFCEGCTRNCVNIEEDINKDVETKEETMDTSIDFDYRLKESKTDYDNELYNVNNSTDILTTNVGIATEDTDHFKPVEKDISNEKSMEDKTCANIDLDSSFDKLQNSNKDCKINIDEVTTPAECEYNITNISNTYDNLEKSLINKVDQKQDTLSGIEENTHCLSPVIDDHWNDESKYEEKVSNTESVQERNTNLDSKPFEEELNSINNISDQQDIEEVSTQQGDDRNSKVKEIICIEDVPNRDAEEVFNELSGECKYDEKPKPVEEECTDNIDEICNYNEELSDEGNFHEKIPKPSSKDLGYTDNVPGECNYKNELSKQDVEYNSEEEEVFKQPDVQSICTSNIHKRNDNEVPNQEENEYSTETDTDIKLKDVNVLPEVCNYKEEKQHIEDNSNDEVSKQWDEQSKYPCDIPESNEDLPNQEDKECSNDEPTPLDQESYGTENITDLCDYDEPEQLDEKYNSNENLPKEWDKDSNLIDKESDLSKYNENVSNQLDKESKLNEEVLELWDKESTCSSDIPEMWDKQSNNSDHEPEQWDKQFTCNHEISEGLYKYSNPSNDMSEPLLPFDYTSNNDDITKETASRLNSPDNTLTPSCENDYQELLSNENDVEVSCTKIQNAEHVFSNKGPPSLKRSLSDSALNSYNDNNDSQQGVEENVQFVWPFKRRKLNNIRNNLLAQNLCNIIQSNRRNSVSTICDEENVSFCILIDNGCIISEDDNDEQGKVCYTELSEECLAEIENNCTKDEDNSEDVTEVISAPQLENEYSDSFIMQGEDEKLEETWVEDVACVETVISDDIAEDIEISGISSPKDDTESDNDESGVFSSNEHTDKVKYIYGEKMCNDDAQFVETLYNTPQMNVNKTLIQRETLISGEYYDNDSLEKILSESNDQELSPYVPEYTEPVFSPGITEVKEAVENKENMNIDIITPLHSQIDPLDTAVDTGIDMKDPESEKLLNTLDEAQDDTVYSSESSVDNVFTYKRNDENTNYTTSSSPEVSSTTSEEKNSSILLKITNYKGSRISQISDVARDSNRSCCKFTEDKDYVQSHSNFTHRPLLTKAAQKYIPPLKESMRDLKVKLSLPQHSLLKLKQLKIAKETKADKPKISIKPKKSKPKFEDVLKSLDEIHIKMHKEKTKKTKKIIPKVVIKKNEHGSHYASTSNKDEFNPDLTGRKWQPWVFIEKNHFIDNMAIKKKTNAIYSHRKRTYVLAEKFQKYKSVQSSNFVISPPISDCPSTGLKYTIRLKHNY